MADRLILNVEVESEDGKERKSRYAYELPEGGTPDRDLQWFSYYLSTEAQVESRWGDFLNKLPDPNGLCSGGSTTITTTLGPNFGTYYDASNKNWAWLEICNLLSSARIYLARSRAYKEFEPKHSGNPGKENQVLYMIHLRKMDEFHLAVKNIKKLEDMILRLIFEALGASLEGIDTSQDEWEYQLTLKRIKDGLKQRDTNEKLKNMPDDEYNELRSIRSAMSHGANERLNRFWQYRHALEHRIPLSVDYVELYVALEDRPVPMIEAGKVVGRQGFIGSRPINPDWRFEELHDITVAVYDHYLKLLKRLNELPTFRGTRAKAQRVE
jgi:hypothetical protein